MRPSTLRDKLLEFHASHEEINSEYNNDNLMRCVTNYLHKKYDNKKVQKLIDDMYNRYDLTQESIDIRRRNQLSDYIDSIILSRIRYSYKSSKLIDIDSLDELKFKALIKQLILHFGYEILFSPADYKNIDIIVHRKDVKIAILSVKSDLNSLVGIKTIRQLRYIANHYHCEQALLFTNTYFCPEAFDEAVEIGVTLFDRDKLIPIVKDLIDGRRQEEKQYLLNEIEEQKNTIYLEGEIKFPKTKVQVVFIKYYIDEDTDYLIFEGKLINTGKRPASNVRVEIKLFNRNNDCIYSSNFPVEKEKLESKEETTFKCSFDEIPQHDWENLCRYQLKLDYKNTYKE
jgi:hypothetical protein